MFDLSCNSHAIFAIKQNITKLTLISIEINALAVHVKGPLEQSTALRM